MQKDVTELEATVKEKEAQLEVDKKILAEEEKDLF